MGSKYALILLPIFAFWTEFIMYIVERCVEKESEKRMAEKTNFWVLVAFNILTMFVIHIATL